jgi:hypothetical protein
VGSSLTNSTGSTSTLKSAPGAPASAHASPKKVDPVKVRENDMYEVWQRGNKEYIRYKPSQLRPIPSDFDENRLVRTPQEAEGLIESYAKMYPLVDDKGEAIKQRPIGRILTKRAFLFLDHEYPELSRMVPGLMCAHAAVNGCHDYYYQHDTLPPSDVPCVLLDDLAQLNDPDGCDHQQDQETGHCTDECPVKGVRRVHTSFKEWEKTKQWLLDDMWAGKSPPSNNRILRPVYETGGASTQLAGTYDYTRSLVHAITELGYHVMKEPNTHMRQLLITNCNILVAMTRGLDTLLRTWLRNEDSKDMYAKYMYVSRSWTYPSLQGGVALTPLDPIRRQTLDAHIKTHKVTDSKNNLGDHTKLAHCVCRVDRKDSAGTKNDSTGTKNKPKTPKRPARQSARKRVRASPNSPQNGDSDAEYVDSE